MASRIYATLPGQDIALLSAEFVLREVAPDALPQAVILVPNRRAAVTMRDAFGKASSGRTLLLPRIFPLADLGDELLSLFGHKAIEALETIPSAMSEWKRLSLLMAQVQLFEKKRGSKPSLDHALRLAKNLATLQDRATRAGVTLSQQELEKLYPADFAEHWQQSLQFLSIVAKTWPLLEQAEGMTTAAAREIAILQYVCDTWKSAAPDYPVFAIGSTASQRATADLLQVVVQLPKGAVILPGLDPDYPMDTWQQIKSGHPYFHLKALLNRMALQPSDIALLGQRSEPSLWLEVLSPAESIPEWSKKKEGHRHQVRMVPCAHAEEEARVISLMLRETAEQKNKSAALVTPDENLMARVAAHLKRYGIIADRLSVGTLGTTQTGSAWLALVEAIESPELTLPLINLLRHPLACIENEAAWRTWLARFEPAMRGMVRHRIGQLPNLPEDMRDHSITRAIQPLVQGIARAAQARLSASQWLEQVASMLRIVIQKQGEGEELVAAALEELVAADDLGPIDSFAVASLLREALSKPWRQAPVDAHPNIIMLTPVEARLQHFDRVVLANMVEGTWPSLNQPSPWLNFTQAEALGLGAPEEHVSLMAHDMLMLGSMQEVFLTYPLREGGSPTARSRFIERLVTWLETQGGGAGTIEASEYRDWANALYAPDRFKPAEPVMPKPPRQQRPTKLRVRDLEDLFSDPFAAYARHTLRLRKLDDFDAEAEAKDFGTLAHEALAVLSNYWNEHKAPASGQTIDAMVQQALVQYAQRPNIRLFWQRRLRQALLFLNEAETERRAHIHKVESEKEIHASIEGIELHGRIDRLEHRDDAAVSIGDYKTGDIPTPAEIQKGKAPQLLAYALLLAEQGLNAASLDYWQLPHGGRAGELSLTPWNADMESLLPVLRTAIADMLDEATAFLARPISDAKSDRYDNDYDGISRYHEWAG